MAQHIGIDHVSENNDILTHYDANFAPIYYCMVDSYPNFETEFSSIAKIDEYGKTWFNKLQLPELVSELHKLQRETKDETISVTIGLLIKFIIDQTSTPHSYIRFSGD
jgi:hypothetical protein